MLVLALVAACTAPTVRTRINPAADILGKTQIDSLSDSLNTAIHQDTASLGADLDLFTRRFLFAKLGLQASSWAGTCSNPSGSTA